MREDGVFNENDAEYAAECIEYRIESKKLDCAVRCSGSSRHLRKVRQAIEFGVNRIDL